MHAWMFIIVAQSCIIEMKYFITFIPATSIVQSKLDYCNSLYHNFLTSQINRLQQIQNSLARDVVKASTFTHIIPILKLLHWLEINERIEYKILSSTFKLLYTTQPPYPYDLISLQTPCNTRSSSVVTLARPPTHSLKLPVVLFATHHLASGINFLTHFVSHVLICLFQIHLFSTIISPHQFYHHHLVSYHPSILHSSKTVLLFKSYPPQTRATHRTDFADLQTVHGFSFLAFISF